MGARCDLPRRRSPNRGGVIRRRSIAAISAALCLLVAGARARADSAQAEALFNDGNRLMKEGKLAQACAAFEACNRIEPGAGTLIQLGQCREKTRQLASAWLAYKQAAARAKDARKRDYATAKIAELQPQLSSLTVAVPDEVRVEGMTIDLGGDEIDPALWNLPQPIDGGDHIVTARAPGREAWKATVHVAPARDKVRVVVPRLPAVSAPLPPPPPPPPLDPAGAPDAGPPGRFTALRTLAVGTAAASVVSVVAGVALGVSANAKQDDAYRLCPEPTTPCARADQANALIRASHDRAHQTNAAFGIAAGAAFATGVLWFLGAPDERAARVSVVPSVAPGEPGVAVWGRF